MCELFSRRFSVFDVFFNRFLPVVLILLKLWLENSCSCLFGFSNENFAGMNRPFNVELFLRRLSSMICEGLLATNSLVAFLWFPHQICFCACSVSRRRWWAVTCGTDLFVHVNRPANSSKFLLCSYTDPFVKSDGLWNVTVPGFFSMEPCPFFVMQVLTLEAQFSHRSLLKAPAKAFVFVCSSFMSSAPSPAIKR